ADRGSLAGRRPEGGSPEVFSAHEFAADRTFDGPPVEDGPADRGSLAGRRPGGATADPDPAIDGGWDGGGADHEARGRPLAAADGSEPLWADEDDDDGEHGGADGRTGAASQG
ncbi:MAG TPA: hypothetical protein VE871_17375, partial [Longimicrobium sp.]|nr:hypothetical protein [Longimicrobium sp.]